MSRDISPDVQTVKLFLTDPHPCSYLDDREAVTAFIDPYQHMDKGLYTQLSRQGFRRSGRYMYTPRCQGCNACISVRLLVNEFAPNRQQRRCAKRNADLDIDITPNTSDSEHYRIYKSYIEERHADGDMYPPSFGQYRDFISNLWHNSQFMEIRLDGKLIAAGVVDILYDGLSAIYTYYLPEYASRSLGTFAIMAEVELARKLGLDYVYLGYWIKNSPKMAYKSNFAPLEQLLDGVWQPVD